MSASFTCPRCGRTSQHPTDAAEGYCGHCHDWTAPRNSDLCPCCGVPMLAGAPGRMTCRLCGLDQAGA